LISWNIFPELYTNFQLLSDCAGKLSFTWNSDGNGLNNLSLIEIEKSIVNFNGVRALLIACCWYYTLEQLISILKSMEAMVTFQAKNVKGFRRIAFGVLAISILEIFHYEWEVGTGVLILGFDYITMIIVLFFFVLAEIFKEGNQLFEEQKYTI
ncbi:MAG: DUF2975 domain-containing protein, partial [Bacteroidota bacterium]